MTTKTTHPQDIKMLERLEWSDIAWPFQRSKKTSREADQHMGWTADHTADYDLVDLSADSSYTFA